MYQAIEEPFIFKRERRTDDPTRFNYIYLYTSIEWRSKIILSVIDLGQLILAISMLSSYLGKAAGNWDCYNGIPLFYVMIPFLGFLCLILTFGRIFVLYYFFVYCQIRA